MSPRSLAHSVNVSNSNLWYLVSPNYTTGSERQRVAHSGFGLASPEDKTNWRIVLVESRQELVAEIRTISQISRLSCAVSWQIIGLRLNGVS